MHVEKVFFFVMEESEQLGERRLPRANTSELSVITKAKELCNYVLTVTDKSPKKFRYTLVSRLQNYSIVIIESLLTANEIRASDMYESPV